MTICLLLTIAQFGWSQSDTEAKAILDQMKSEYDSYTSVAIDFTLNIEIPEQAMETRKVIQQIEFKPLDRDSEYSKMRLTLVKGSKQLKRVKIFAKDGSRFTMTVNKLESNKEYAASTFEFDSKAYPDIYIEDLRL